MGGYDDDDDDSEGDEDDEDNDESIKKTHSSDIQLMDGVDRGEIEREELEAVEQSEPLNSSLSSSSSSSSSPSGERREGDDDEDDIDDDAIMNNKLDLLFSGISSYSQPTRSRAEQREEEQILDMLKNATDDITEYHY